MDFTCVPKYLLDPPQLQPPSWSREPCSHTFHTPRSHPRYKQRRLRLCSCNSRVHDSSVKHAPPCGRKVGLEYGLIQHSVPKGLIRGPPKRWEGALNSEQSFTEYVWLALSRQDNDNDNGHSFSQLSEHKALTCPKGQSAWALNPPWLAKGKSLRAEISVLDVPALLWCFMNAASVRMKASSNLVRSKSASQHSV